MKAKVALLLVFGLIFCNTLRPMAQTDKQVLTYFIIQHQYKKVIQAYYQSHDWEGWEQKQLRKVVG